MEEKKYTADGINIEVDKYEDEKIRERRIMAYAFKMVRKESGMNRKDFAEWLGIPYRTMQEWERTAAQEAATRRENARCPPAQTAAPPSGAIPTEVLQTHASKVS